MQAGAVLGQQSLGRAHHALARIQCREQQRANRFDAADHLDHDVDVLADSEGLRVGGQQVLRYVRVSVGSPDRDSGQFQRHTYSSGQIIGLICQQPGDRGTDDATAE